MAQQEFYTILTSAGLAYEANRKALGLPIKLVEMSVGDGNGAVYNPSAAQTALAREVWRGPINALLQDATNPSYLVGELSLPDDVGGWYVREVGFWTDSGILYAVGKYPESFKPQLATGAGKEFYIRAIFETSNAESVTLVVDDTVVKATRAFVIDYVSAELAKRDSKNSVRVATTGAINLSGAQNIDGVAVVAGDRVLVKNQASAAQNGIYVAAVGAWSRAADADASLEVTPGMLVPVEAGTANGDSVWQLVTDGPITLGTTSLVFELLAGRTGISAGTYRSVTVDKYGRVTGGTNPTTMAGYGITDAPMAGIWKLPATPPAMSYSPYYVGLVRSPGPSGNDVRGADKDAYVFSYHTGISLSAHPSYGGVRIFTQAQSAPDHLHDGVLKAEFGSIIKLFGPVTLDGRPLYAAAPGDLVLTYSKTPPPNTLKANGAAVPVASYSALAEAIYVGDELNATAAWGYRCTSQSTPTTTRSTTGAFIVLPDQRAESIRGFDDGRGIDANRAWASWQDGMVGPHIHPLKYWSWKDGTGTGSHPYVKPFDTATGITGEAPNGTGQNSGTENRMRNLALLACIRY